MLFKSFLKHCFVLTAQRSDHFKSVLLKGCIISYIEQMLLLFKFAATTCDNFFLSLTCFVFKWKTRALNYHHLTLVGFQVKQNAMIVIKPVYSYFEIRTHCDGLATQVSLGRL